MGLFNPHSNPTKNYHYFTHKKTALRKPHHKPMTCDWERGRATWWTYSTAKLDLILSHLTQNLPQLWIKKAIKAHTSLCSQKCERTNKKSQLSHSFSNQKLTVYPFRIKYIYIYKTKKNIEYCNVDLDLDKWIMNNYNLED